MKRNTIIVSLAALTAFLLSWWISEAVFHRAPITTDEQSYQLQAHLFAQGKIKYPPPPFIQPFRYPMVIVDKNVGWLSRYPPGHSLWLMFGVWMNNLYVMVALAASLGVLLTAGAARRIGASVTAVVLMLLLSPFYVFTYGTLLSHTSGFVAAAAMLLAYILWKQREQPVWAVLAGLAWAWLFLNRTYTALLMALPFAVDALWHLWKRRDARALMGVFGFAAASCVGVLAILAYNYAALGHPFEMTYLHYDPTDKLGFGLRHYGPTFPAPDPVDYTPAMGWADLKANVLLMDQWMFGFRGGLLVWFGLTVAGWSRQWSALLVGAVCAVCLGYVYFWYPGWNETGPIYFFEVYPAMVLTAGLGVAALWRRFQTRHRAVRLLALGIVALWAGASFTFALGQGRYLQGETAPRRAVMDAITSAPPQSLVFVRRDVVDRVWANHDLVFSPHGIEGDIIVARWLEEGFNRVVASYFTGYQPLAIKFVADEFVLRPYEPPPLDIDVRLIRLHRRTGSNIWDEDDPALYVRIARPPDPQGVLAFGTHHTLYPGHYVLEYDMRTTIEGAALIEVVSSAGSHVIKQMSVPRLEAWEAVRMEFSAEDFISVEPRVLYMGFGTVEISGMRMAEMVTGEDRSME